MKIARMSIERPLATLMIYLAIGLLSFISLRQLSVDLLPDISYPCLSIVTLYSGVAPEEVETMITAPLEAAVSRIPGLRRVESVSKEGLSFMILEFGWGTNMDFALLHVREKLDSARHGGRLPEGVDSPTIIPLDPQSEPIMILAVGGRATLPELKEISEEFIKPRLEQIEGLGSAEVAGGIEPEIQIELRPELLPLCGLTIEQISQRISAFNRNLQGGTVKKGRFKYALRVVGEFSSLNQIGEISLKYTSDRGVVRLKDVAAVRDGVKERQGMIRLNGRESIGLMIRKEADANTVKVTKEAHKILDQIRKDYPQVEIKVVSEQSQHIQKAIASVEDEIIQGGLLAFLVLLIFLQDFRTALTIFAVIAISVMATFNLMFFRQINLNIMSLGGLALGVGMLDDAAIVVTENIFRHRSLGKPSAEAAYVGTHEVGTAVSSTVFTTVVVFLPVIYIHGIAGQLFRDQALTVTFSLLASLIVSLTLVPMLMSWNLKRSAQGRGDKIQAAEKFQDINKAAAPDFRHNPQARRLFLPFREIRRLVYAFSQIISRNLGFILILISQRLLLFFHHLSLPFRHLVRAVFQGFNSVYGRFIERYDCWLAWSLNHKGRVVMVSLTFFGLTSFLGLKLPRELMPAMRVSSFNIRLKTPVDYSFEQTTEVVTRIESWLSRNSGVDLFFSQTGVVSGLEASASDISVNSASFNVKIKRAPELDSMIEDLRTKLADFPDVLYSIAKEQATIAPFLIFSSSQLEMKVRGADFNRLMSITAEFKERLRTVKGITGINTTIGEGKPEFVIKIKREAFEKYDISPADIGTCLVNSVRGKIAGQFREMEKKSDILVRLNRATRENLEKILDQSIPYRKDFVPLREFVFYEVARGPNEIRRENQQREILVTANLREARAGRVRPEVRKAIAGMSLPANYRIDLVGEQEELTKSFQSLLWAFALSALLVYMIMAAQFESLIHPLLIMFTIPMGLAGTCLLLWAAGLSINIISIIGIVISVGIVTDNAIVKIDYTNLLRREGMGLREAVCEGSAVRLRPILMATSTTVIGLLPLSLGFGEGAELQQSLGVAVMGGLISSTFLTLILIPVIYEWVEERAAGKKKP